jgi:hypothetical protein
MDYTPINQKQPGDCGYVCAYAGKKIALYANDMFKAKTIASEHWKVPKSKQHLVSSYLCENRDGSQYVQSTNF